MTGTGTGADPYIVENYKDFCSMSGGINSYYKLAIDIDFSKIDRQATDSPITMCFLQLDGDGHTISNYYRRESTSTSINSLFNSTQTKSFTIKNLTFKGICLVGGCTQLTKATSSVTIYYTNCKMGIKIADTYQSNNGLYPLFSNAIVNDCEIFLDGTSKYTKTLSLYEKGEVNGCLVKFNMIYENPDVTEPITVLCKSATCTGVVGKISSLNSSGARYKMTYGKSASCYYAIEMDYAEEIKFGSFEGVNFYDKEVMGNVAEKMPESDILYALTTEQCKSVEYLQSIGFPCISGELI